MQFRQNWSYALSLKAHISQKTTEFMFVGINMLWAWAVKQGLINELWEAAYIVQVRLSPKGKYQFLSVHQS